MKRPTPASVLAALLVTLGLVLTAPATAHAVEKLLSVPAYKQEKSQWCWATAVQMIVKFKAGTSATQCAIVKKGKQTSACANEPGTRTEVKRALNAYGVNAGSQPTLTWSIVTNELKNNRAIYSGIVWSSSGGGHAHVIRGYYDTGYSWGVSYIDPASGTTTSREWSSYTSNSSWKTSTGIINLSKL